MYTIQFQTLSERGGMRYIDSINPNFAKEKFSSRGVYFTLYHVHSIQNAAEQCTDFDHPEIKTKRLGNLHLMPHYALKYIRCHHYFTRTAKAVQSPIAATSTLYKVNINTGARKEMCSQCTTQFATTTFTALQLRTDNFETARKHTIQSMNLRPLNRIRLDDRPCLHIVPRNGNIVRTHPLLKGHCSQLFTVNHRELFTHQLARKLFTTHVQFGALVGWQLGSRNNSPTVKKKLHMAKIPFLGLGDEQQ